MKNTHIKVGETVPADIRIEVYRGALAQLEGRSLFERRYCNYYLCHKLPTLLYGENRTIIQDTMGAYVTNKRVQDMFPELGRYLRRLNTTVICNNEKRISLLKRWIKKLES